MQSSTIYGYVRVSSAGQQNNNSLKSQIEQLLQDGIKPENIYGDVEKGTTLKRPSLMQLLNILKPNDVVKVIRLDRAARSLKDSYKLLSLFQERKVTLASLEGNILSDTPVGQLSYTLLAAVSEYEMNIRRERIMTGIAAKKASSYKYMGRKPYITKKLKNRFYKLLNTGVTKKSELVAQLGINVQTLTLYLNKGLLSFQGPEHETLAIEQLPYYVRLAENVQLENFQKMEKEIKQYH